MAEVESVEKKKAALVATARAAKANQERAEKIKKAISKK